MNIFGLKIEYPDADEKIKHILENSSDLLNDSITLQKEREEKAYSIIKIPKGKDEVTIEDFEKALYGYGNKNQDSKPDDAIKILMEFLKDEYAKMNKSSANKIVKAKEILERFYNIKETFKEWYETNTGETKKRIEANGGLPLEEMIELEKVWNTEINNSVFKKLKNKKEEPFIIYERVRDNPQYTMSKEMAEQIITEYKNKQNDMFGLLGEAATEYCVNKGSKDLIEGVDEIIVNQTARREGNSKTVKEQVDSYYANYKQRLKDKVTEITNNENFELEGAFTLEAKSNLKADEVFEVTITMNGKSELVTFGVSNKTSYTNNLTMKIQETSLEAIINNLYKVDPKLMKYTTEIVKTLKEITMYGAIFSGWGTYEHFMTFATYKDMFNQIVNDYAYIWFTEGDVGLSHADFFSIYKDNKLHLIPMSAILEKIKEKLVKFNAIDLFEYYYSNQNVLTVKRREKLETDIEAMEKKGKEDQLSRSETIMLNRNKRELKYKGIQDLYNSNVVLPNDIRSLLNGDFTGTFFKEIINNMSIPSRLEIGSNSAKIIVGIR